MKRHSLKDLVCTYPLSREDETVLEFLDAEGKKETAFSFKQLHKQSVGIAEGLYWQSSKREKVILTIDRQADFTLGFFGCILAGKIPAPIAPLGNRRNQMSWGRLEQILRKHPDCSIMLSASDKEAITSFLAEQGLNYRHIYVFESLSEGQQHDLSLPEPHPDDAAYIQYSSGSTSAPKGIVLTHRQVLKNMEKMYRVFDRGQLVRVAGWIPFYHDMGLVGHLFTVLFESGFGVFLNPRTFLSKPRLWLETISKYEANSQAAPTFAFDHCVRKIKEIDGLDLSCWDQAYVGSETVSTVVLQRFYEKFKTVGFRSNTFRPVYGLAEATLLAAGGKYGLDALELDIQQHELPTKLQRALVPYTLDPEATDLQIWDPESEQMLPEGSVGEIVIKANHALAGYLVNDQQLEGLQSELLRTGDMGYVQEGNLYITGRLKEILIVRGVNYSAEDLEHAIRTNAPALRPNDATVCLQDPTADHEHLVVIQEIQRHLSDQQKAAVLKHLQGRLAECFMLRATEIVLIPQGTLSRTPNYKIARSKSLEDYFSKRFRVLDSVNIQKAIASEATENQSDPVVIVGMSCKFPGGVNSPEEFWKLLVDGVDAITEVPEDRWDNKLFYSDKVADPGKVNTNWGGFVDDISHFDPALFGISGYEAAEMDPQQRLLMETSWRLLEQSGITKKQLKGSDTGVFVGISTNDYLYMKIKLTSGLEGFNAYSGLGNAHSIAANRISYFYDLKGPSMAVDTACSSSLSAFHLGVQAILAGDSEQAIVGGVNAMLSPGSTVTLSQFGMMAPDGRCKAFDSKADGYVRSEGCGLVMIKRKSAAIRDGNTIYAEVAATAAAQDGASPGITYPNALAQRNIIKKTLKQCDFDPSGVSYIEAHGTGTASGDPVEMEQLIHHYGGLSTDSACYVGSVKANIGHLEASAGIAGVIKGVLMLQHHKIPPQIHLQELNPKIDLGQSRLKLNRTLVPWNVENSQSRRMAVSSFGFGGSLAHVVLTQWSEVQVPKSNIPTDHLSYPFLLSGYSPEHLHLQAKHWVNWLDSEPIISFPDMNYTQARHRENLGYRVAFLVDDRKALRKSLEVFNQTQKSPYRAVKDPKLCFLFTGQGEYYYDMGQSLYDRYPVYRKHYDRLLDSLDLSREDDTQLRTALDKEKIFKSEERDLQPLQFATQYALAQLLIAFDLSPDYLLGYSFGEYVAACLAGCFSPEQGMSMVRKRGELLDQLQAVGSMVTIFAPPEEVIPLMVADRINIAVHNSPTKTVISGDQLAIEKVCDHFKEKEVQFYYLKTIKPYHSPLIAPMLEDFETYLNNLTFKNPTSPWISSVTGGWKDTAPETSHWVAQTRQTVYFAEATSALAELDERISYIEVGPGASTLSAIFDNLKPRSEVMVRTIAQSKKLKPEADYLLDALGKLYVHGFDINWDNFYCHQTYPANIPGLALIRKPYWLKGIDAQKMSAFAISENSESASPAITADSEPASGLALHYHLEWQQAATLEAPDNFQQEQDALNWVIIGNYDELTAAVIEQLKQTPNAHVFWMGQRKKGGPKPDAEIGPTPSREELQKKIDKIINLLTKRSVRDYKLVVIAPVIEEVSDHGIHIDGQLQDTVLFYTQLLKAIKGLMFSQPIWTVTRGVNKVRSADKFDLNLSHAPMWGYLKTAYLEHPEWRGGCIDLALDEDTAIAASAVIKKVFKPGLERCVTLRGDQVYLEKIKRSFSEPDTSKPLRDDGSYLVTGGLGGLGLQTAHWLVDKGVKHISLLSRRKLPEPASWTLDGLESEVDRGLLKELISLRDKLETLQLISLDLTNIPALQAFMAEQKTADLPLRGIIHAAGVNWFSKLIDVDVDLLRETLKIKVDATWELHKASLDMDLDCFLMYSSVSAIWGSVELSHYTAANFYLDTMARYRNSLGLPGLAIDWGPWAEVGMSSGAREVEVLGKLGFNLLAPNTALEALDKAISGVEPVCMIADINWDSFRPFVDFSLRPSLFTEVMPDATELMLATDDRVSAILECEPKEAREQIESIVRLELRRVMLVESMERIGDTERFNMLGMDSLMAISFVVEIEQYFNIKLPNTLPYNYPHIKAVSDYLFQQVYVPAHPEAADFLKEEVGEDETLLVAENSVMVSSKPAGDWLVPLNNKTEHTTHIVYCFPSIGSGISIFEPMARLMPDQVQLVGLQLPGREHRSGETPYTAMADLLADFNEQFKAPGLPFSFYGHSFGGNIAFECALSLHKSERELPVNLIVSGANPKFKQSAKSLHKLPEDQMIAAVLEAYPNNQDAAARQSAVESIAPIVRADLKLMETHLPEGLSVPLNITAIAGTLDAIATVESSARWQELTTANFTLTTVASGHDILRQQLQALTAILLKELSLEESAEIQ